MSTSLRLSRQEWLLLGGFSLAALLLRLWFLRLDYTLSPDGFYYATLGAKLASGDWRGGVSLYWPPGYPFLIGLFSYFFEDLAFAGQLAPAVLGSLLLIPEYLLVRGLYGSRAARVGAFLLIFQPQLLRGSLQVLADVPFTFFFLTAVLLGLPALFEGRIGLFFGTGLALAACYLTRPEAFGFFLMFACMAVAVPSCIRAPDRRRTLAGLGLLFLGFGLLALPYVAHLRRETGRWTISAKLDAHLLSGAFNWRKLTPDGEYTYADRFYGDVRAPVAEPGSARERPEPAPAVQHWPTPTAPRPGFSPRAAAARLGRLARELSREYVEEVPSLFPPLVLVLLGVGLAAGGRGGDRGWKDLYLLSFLVAALLGYAMIYADKRYLMPLVPLAYAWVAAGLVEIAGRLQSRGDPTGGVRRLLDRAILPALIGVLALSMAREVTYPLRAAALDHPHEMRMAGLWIRQAGRPDPVILANSPVVAFYANAGRSFYTPDEPLDRVIAHARRRGADYLVVDERKVVERSLRDQQPLLEDGAVPPALVLVYRFEEIPGARVRVYEVTRE